MHGVDQYVPVRAEPHQRVAHRGRFRQVERHLTLRAGQFVDLAVDVVGAEVVEAPRHPGASGGHGHHLSVADRPERRTQVRVPVEDAFGGQPEPVGVERPVQFDDLLDDVWIRSRANVAWK